jgi:hypothetical protein
MLLSTTLGLALMAALIQRLIAIRVWGTSVFSKGLLGDASVHFTIVRHLVENPQSRFIRNFLISPEPMSYPILFHRFAKLFSLAVIRRVPWLPNLTLHGIAVVLLGAVAWALGSGSLLVLSVVFAVYLITPGQWIFVGPSIAYLGLSERYFGRLTCSLAYFGLGAGTVFGSPWLSVIGTLFAILAMMSSIFARQALLFGVPLLSLVLLDVRPLLLISIALALSLVFGGAHFWDGLRHTVIQWRMYRSHTKRSPNVRKAMVGFFRWQMSGDRSLWRKVASNLWQKDPTRIFFWYPELFFAGFLVATTQDATMIQLSLCLLPPIFIYLVTLSERFNHLGEAYRYIEYCLTFTVPVLAALAYDRSVQHLVALIIFFLLSTILVAIRYILQLRSLKTNTLEGDAISEFIEETGITGSAVIFPVSMRLGADLVARRGDWKSFWWQPGIISEQIYSEYIEEYPFLSRNWRSLAQRHGVTHIICDKRHDSKLKSWQYDFSDVEKIAENNSFVAYRVSQVTTQPR